MRKQNNQTASEHIFPTICSVFYSQNATNQRYSFLPSINLIYETLPNIKKKELCPI